MAESAYLASAVVTGLLVVTTLLVLSRGRNWIRYPEAVGGSRAYRPAEERGGGFEISNGARVAVFLLLVALFGGGSVAAVQGTIPTDGAVMPLASAFAGVLGLFVFAGVYQAARSRGRPSSLAAGAAVTVLGLLFLVAILANLVVGA